MEHSAKLPQLSDSGDGEDRLSALPDDILIHILVKLLDTAVAARTSVLSSRWRRLWTLLPQLWFHPSTVPLGIRSALTALEEAPALHRLHVTVRDATPESLEAWLQIAARRLSGDLVLINTVTVDEVPEGHIELPCFENATSIRLELEYLGLAVPPSGLFARLTDIFLDWIELRGPCMLGDAVSSPRCPVLCKLTVHHVWGLHYFAIHSDSLLEIVLDHLHDLQQLTVTAPVLKLLNVTYCFAEGSSDNEPFANISAPQLVSLFWMDVYDPRFMQFGKMENLNLLTTDCFIVYGRVGSNHKLHNGHFAEILQLWRRIQDLRVILMFLPKDITNWEHLMEDITRFPNIRNLTLHIMAKGGSSLYNFLSLCTGVRKLDLTLADEKGYPEAQTADKPALNFLREVENLNLRGTEHEAGLAKRLLDWATVLETMKVTFAIAV